MSIYVNTNTSSLRAQSALSKATSKLSDSYAKLSSGKRINSAKDDAAGLQIASRMTSQINGLTQGNRKTPSAPQSRRRPTSSPSRSSVSASRPPSAARSTFWTAPWAPM